MTQRPRTLVEDKNEANQLAGGDSLDRATAERLAAEAEPENEAAEAELDAHLLPVVRQCIEQHSSRR